MLNRSGEALAFDMVSFVSLDPFGDGVYVGELLRKNKRKTVLMLNEGSGTAFWGVKRYEGVELGLRHGNTEEFLLRNIPVNENEFENFVNEIKKSPSKCTVIAVNNYYAAKLIDTAENAGLSAPEDFELISFDDNPAYRAYNITSMSAPMKEIGELFARFVCEDSWINAYRGKISIKLPGELVIRETFKPELI
jgi:DNA-binding LacI/PurR family transcriptional regulator